MNHDPDETSILERRVRRENSARREAERLLEEKSREVFLANEELSKLAELARQQADQLRAIVDHVGEGIITYEGSGKILSFNVAAEKIFGHSIDQTSRILISDLVPSLDEAAEDPTNELASITTLPFEHVGRKKDGTEFPIEMTLSSLSIGDDPVQIALIRDRTERRKLERQLVHAQKMESIGQLASGIAHEINTPMQFVGDNVRFLQEVFQELDDLFLKCLQFEECDDKSNLNSLIEQVRHVVQKMDFPELRKEISSAAQQTLEGVDRVTHIVQALKEFSHPGEQRKVAVDLNESIRNSIAVSRNHWKYVADVETDLDPNIPLSKCYASEFNQVILNILINAGQAIEEKNSPQQGTIRIRSRFQEGKIVITISDDGVGMSEEIRSRIFDPFFTTKPVGKGTGQGLAICYAVIVDRMGGQIDCDSQVNVGTTFTIELPFETASPSDGREIQTSPQVTGEIDVLFVDDDPNILNGLRRMLRNHPPNWKLHFAGSGASAIEFLEKCLVDAVITDMRMPEMDGDQLLSRVKNLHPRIIRGVLSGQAETEHALRSIGNAHFFLSKPSRPADVRTSLERIEMVKAAVPDVSLRERLLSMKAVLCKKESLQQLENQSGQSNSPDLTEIISNDLGLSARIMQLVCASFFGRPQASCNIPEAVKGLDAKMVTDLFRTMTLAESPPDSMKWFPLEELTQECQLIRRMAGELARIENVSESVRSHCVNAGWFAGFGRVVLAKLYPDEYRKLVTEIAPQSSGLLAAELQCFGCHHFQVASFLLGSWGLPMPIVDALGSCLDPAQVAEEFTPTLALQAAIVLAATRGQSTSQASTSQASTLQASLFESELIDQLSSKNSGQLSRWRDQLKSSV